MTSLLFAPRGRAVLGLSAILFMACGGRTGDDLQDANVAGAGSGAGGWSSVVSVTSLPPTNVGGASWAIPTTSSPWVTATGGAPFSLGGTKAYMAGGAPVFATGGKAYAATGGKAYSMGGAITATGGKAYSMGGAATGGKAYSMGGSIALAGGTTYAAGGTTIPAKTATGGSSAISCASVTCAAIPTTCKQIVQPVGACCPTCLDTGCPPCTTIACPAGQHVETVVGDCCPSCVADPPDPCITGQQNYATARQQMVDKYSSSGCSNSTECIIVPENNLCASTCGVPMLNHMVDSFINNLETTAKTYCTTCKPTTAGVCPTQVPACVNGKCVAVSPS